MSKERSSRYSYRYCRICRRKNNKENSKKADSQNKLITPCDCNPGSNYVHLKCQSQYMSTNNRIHCERCKCQFRGLNYEYNNKSFVQYIWDDDSARTKLFNSISLLCSMVVCINSLWMLITCDWYDFWEDIMDIDYELSLPSIKHNINIMMMIHLKLILPFVSIVCGLKQPYTIWKDYQQYSNDHFNLSFYDDNDESIIKEK